MTKSERFSTRTIKRRLRGGSVPVFKELGRIHYPKRNFIRDEIPMAPAYFIGWQQGTNGVSGFPLYTLMEEIPGHPQWSTVSGRTLKAAGFKLPSREIRPELEIPISNIHQNTMESTEFSVES